MINWQIKLCLLMTYFVFAIILNSVGTVILQVVNHYDVTKEGASILEGFKDLPIAIVSFLIAARLPQFGFKNAMVTGLLLIVLASIMMPILPSFWMTKIFFLISGISFALVKISIYSIVGQISDSSKKHASFMNTLEGLFMVGVLSGYWLFAWFINPSDPNAWLNVYWVICILSIITCLLIVKTPFNEMKNIDKSNAEQSSYTSDLIAMLNLTKMPMVFVFIASAFLYVLVEQGIGTWLPTFNNEVLKLPIDMSVAMTSIFAASLAIGRLSAGVILARINWYFLVNICLVAIGVLIILVLPLTKNIQLVDNLNWFNAPFAAYIFPLIGLFMAPIYPAINSAMLSALPVQKHAAMTGLIVIFSALGGTTGSIITGFTFAHFDGQTAFYFSLLPLSLIMLTLFIFNKINTFNQQEKIMC
ncbi:MFS transporter [Pseudoalteromonas denitrificans]|uniref:Fucose permease n=1 Tax=Pseudoalteromonas denitrificans DSM 6059 TaxID=1123010 RepID=A0A1I1LXH4_9GAMM|nr:MFS transporter [Pseudoalteromonas denitrificans]SFC77947.1 Fucose permease [Pseudoalteromonas denitrificans DSM 6059]